MKWLVVIANDIVPAVLRKALAAAGAKTAPFCEPVPLSAAETSIEVEGPDDLPSRLETNDGIKGVYPSSDFQLY